MSRAAHLPRDPAICFSFVVHPSVGVKTFAGNLLDYAKEPENCRLGRRSSFIHAPYAGQMLFCGRGNTIMCVSWQRPIAQRHRQN
ncbi:MAG: hypothetical protein R3D69_16960 [Xanthobacteraceae bacterium]